MNSEEIHLKSWSNKIQEMYKMFLGSQTFRSNITSIRMTLQYNDKGVLFFFSFFFLAVDYVQLIKHHSPTQCNDIGYIT